MSKYSTGNRLVIWILGSLSTITPFAIDLYLPAFASIARDFNTVPAQVALSVSSYFIGMAVGQILYGPLLDRFGRKLPLYLGLSVFIIACVGCMLSWGIEMLVIFRFIQALGGSVAWVAAVAMVRDFFPVQQSSRIFSLLVLIIGVSPLLAPTIGGFITSAFRWEAIFVFLILMVVVIGLAVFFYLPERYKPDHSVSLRPGPMLQTFGSILKHPQFYTYTFSGAFSFSTLFIYVTGSPVIFMDNFGVSPQVYGGIFAILAAGLVGGSQLNIYLTKKISSEKIFRVTLTIQVITSLLFFIFVLNDMLGLYSTIAMFFICLSCIGIINPNANALAIAPFTKNVGSASALLGFTQTGLAGLSSSGVGLFNAKDAQPVAALMAVTCVLAFVVLMLGRRRIGETVIRNDMPGTAMH